MSGYSDMRRHAHPDEVRHGAMVEFVERWQDFTSPSAAAAAIAKEWGIGRTTLAEWLRAEGQWPHTRVSANLRLAAENEKLRRKLQALTGDENP